MNLRSVLVDHFDYLPENVTLLTDETETKPTSQNILKELYKLLLRSMDEEVKQIWISYSGHGTWTADMNNDESDGRDEMIVPLDFKCIRDDVLNHIISLIQRNTRCMCLFDSCHSGTVLDLPFVYDLDTSRLIVENNQEEDDAKDIIMFSGCRDDQYSQEAWVGRVQGVMTTIFIYLLRKYDYKVSYDTLIREMNEQLNMYGFEQKPLLSCNLLLDVNEDFNC